MKKCAPLTLALMASLALNPFAYAGGHNDSLPDQPDQFRSSRQAGRPQTSAPEPTRPTRRPEASATRPGWRQVNEASASSGEPHEQSVELRIREIMSTLLQMGALSIILSAEGTPQPYLATRSEPSSLAGTFLFFSGRGFFLIADVSFLTRRSFIDYLSYLRDFYNTQTLEINRVPPDQLRSILNDILHLISSRTVVQQYILTSPPSHQPSSAPSHANQASAFTTTAEPVTPAQASQHGGLISQMTDEELVRFCAFNSDNISTILEMSRDFPERAFEKYARALIADWDTRDRDPEAAARIANGFKDYSCLESYIQGLRDVYFPEVASSANSSETSAEPVTDQPAAEPFEAHVDPMTETTASMQTVTPLGLQPASAPEVASFSNPSEASAEPETDASAPQPTANPSEAVVEPVTETADSMQTVTTLGLQPASAPTQVVLQVGHLQYLTARNILFFFAFLVLTLSITFGPARS